MVTVVYYDLIDVLQGKVFTTVQIFGVSKINTFNEQGYIELMKNDCKYTYNVTKDLHFQINVFFILFINELFKNAS